VTNELDWSLAVDPCGERCDSGPWHAEAHETHRRGARNGEAIAAARRQHGVAFFQNQFAVASLGKAAPAQIDSEQEIILARGSDAAWPGCLAQAGEGARH
jgi:hypothetical protein